MQIVRINERRIFNCCHLPTQQDFIFNWRVMFPQGSFMEKRWWNLVLFKGSHWKMSLITSRAVPVEHQWVLTSVFLLKASADNHWVGMWHPGAEKPNFLSIFLKNEDWSQSSLLCAGLPQLPLQAPFLQQSSVYLLFSPFLGRVL